MVFLDIEKKAWILNKLEIPAIENVPMKDMLWFREKIKEVSKIEKSGEITQDEAFAVDDEWWDKICKIGLGCSVAEVLDSGISEPEFRELMAEVYSFLAISGTIERAKLSAIYDPEILKKEQSQKETIQN